MNRTHPFLAASLVAAALLTASAAPAAGQDADVEKYLWQTPRTTDVAPEATEPMVRDLRREVQKVLDAGPLAPLRLTYADLTVEAYWLYYERGRTITTLAYAYPHATPEQQQSIRQYVRALLESDTHAPWIPGILGRDEGAERRLHGRPVAEGPYVSPDSVPTLHTLYGLWLYGDRTGDWEAIESRWPQIRAYYGRAAGSTPVLYGQMGAHVAMARMARRFGDQATERAATTALAAALREGLDPAKIEERAQKTRFAKFYDRRNAGAFPGQPWMFLDAPPEILRFLGDQPALREEVTGRVDRMAERYPLWWLHQAPYFTRWTGDEGVGTPSEIIGMIYPVKRWIADEPAEQLAQYMRSVPTGIGDSYWLEALVQTIEAFGQTQWQDVRE